jgi:hypothetical protein
MPDPVPVGEGGGDMPAAVVSMSCMGTSPSLEEEEEEVLLTPETLRV